MCPAEARVHTRLSSCRALGRAQIVIKRFPAQGEAAVQKLWRASRRPPRRSPSLIAAIAGTISLVTSPCSQVSSSMIANDPAVRSRRVDRDRQHRYVPAELKELVAVRRVIAMKPPDPA